MAITQEGHRNFARHIKPGELVVERFTPHFATCPNATDHRRKKPFTVPVNGQLMTDVTWKRLAREVIK